MGTFTNYTNSILEIVAKTLESIANAESDIVEYERNLSTEPNQETKND